MTVNLVRIALSALGALVLSTACVTAATAPAMAAPAAFVR